MKYIQGIQVSPGIAIGPVFTFKKVDIKIPENKVEDTKKEVDRFLSAIKKAKNKLQLKIVLCKGKSLKEEKEILSSHLAMLDDPELLSLVKLHIQERNTNAEKSLMIACDHFICLVEDIDDDYLKGRAKDIQDIAERVLEQLLDIKIFQYYELNEPSIIVADELTVNDIVGFNKELILGIITSRCGITDHAAIMARSYDIPMITGILNIYETVVSNDDIILNGREGKVYLENDKNAIKNAKRKLKEETLFKSNAKEKAFEIASTLDGHQIKVCANIGSLENAEKAIENGAEGIGLFRTELLFIDNHEVLDEDIQYEYYRKIFDVFEGKEIIIRTLDIGGDKQIRSLKLKSEENPALGLRGIRLSMKYMDQLLKPQIKAILRSAGGRHIKIMIPMVTSINEVKEFRRVLNVCQTELLENKIISDKPNIEIGIMVEVPSTAIQSDVFAKDVDFFSIGTNDLTQYTLSADRTNADVSYLNQGIHPTVLYLMNNVVRSARKYSKSVGICGELASDQYAIPILVGLGIKEFSVNPVMIPIVKERIRKLNYSKTKLLAERVLKCEEWDDIKNTVDELSQ